jgi:hypothetical protein
LARQLARRRQRERTAGALVVVLGIAVLVVALFALREPGGHVSSAQSKAPSNVAKQSPAKAGHTTSTPHSSTPVATGSHGSGRAVPLVVLNDSSTIGLAAQAAQRFESGGWRVTSFGNYQNNIASTCAYYDPTNSAAKAAAQALQAQYPVIKRVQPRFTPDAGAQPLPSAPVVVVLTSDYTAS